MCVEIYTQIHRQKGKGSVVNIWGIWMKDIWGFLAQFLELFCESEIKIRN